MGTIKFVSLVLCALFIGLLFNTKYAHADGTFNIVTSPPSISLQGVPGSTLTTDIRVKNNGLIKEKLKVSLMKFSAYGEEGKPSIQERGTGDDYFDWVSFSPQTFEASTDEWMTVKMSINLPSTAAYGYYYAVVISRADDPQVNTKENTLIGSTAVLVLVDAKVPGANRSASITSFNADKKFYEFLPSVFTVKIKNTGNVHVVPAGNIFITRGGKPISTIEINKGSGNVLPNSSRNFSASWDDGFPVYVQKEINGKVVLDKKDKSVSTLQWDFSKASHLKFGHYTAHLVMAYDNGTQDVPLDATVSFWVVPIRAIFITLAIPIVPSVLVYLLMKRRVQQRRFNN